MAFESFLKARSKNLVEEVRLSHIMQTMELEKKQWEKESFNQNFEDQRIAYILKRESKAIKTKRERKENKNVLEAQRKPAPSKTSSKLPDISFLTRSLVGADDEWPKPQPQEAADNVDAEDVEIEIVAKKKKVSEFPTPCSFPAMKVSGGFSNISSDILKRKKPKRILVQSDSLPDISVSNKVTSALPEINVEDTAPQSVQVGPDQDESKPEGLAALTGNMKFANVVEKLLGRKTGESEVAEDNADTENASCRGVPSERTGRGFGLISPAPKKINLKKLVGRLFPQVIRRAKSLDQLEKLIDDEEAVADGTAPKETNSEDAAEDDDLEDDNEPMDPVIIVNDYWVGDPKAIGSVRRARQPPEVMTARHKNVGEVMKLIRDLPMYPSCSRNCNKPGALFDSMVSSGPQVMAPSLAKANLARHKKAKDRLQRTVKNINQAVQVVAAFNQAPPLPAIAVAAPVVENAAPSVQKKIHKEFQQRQQSLRKTTRELRKNLKMATERQTFKPSQQVVVDGRGARVQIAYTFDPVSRLRKQQGPPTAAS